MSLVAHHTGAYSGFLSMKQLEVFLLSPGWDASAAQTFPSIKFAGTVHMYPFIHLGGERLCESKVSCSRTQHRCPGQDWNLDHSIWSPAH